VIPCEIAALFGSSWHVMSGPTNANSLALFAMLAPLAAPFSQGYIDLALTVTIPVGLLQLAVGACGWARFRIHLACRAAGIYRRRPAR